MTFSQYLSKFWCLFYLYKKKENWHFEGFDLNLNSSSHPQSSGLQYFLVKNRDVELYHGGRTESELYWGLRLTDYLKTEQFIPLRATRSPVSYKCMTEGGEQVKLWLRFLCLSHWAVYSATHTQAHTHCGDKELLKGTWAFPLQRLFIGCKHRVPQLGSLLGRFTRSETGRDRHVAEWSLNARVFYRKVHFFSWQHLLIPFSVT